MNIEVKFKGISNERIDFIEFGENENTKVVDWDESQNDTGFLYGKGVSINKEYGNGRIDELRWLPVTGIQLYNENADTESDFVEIVSITIYDGEEVYEVPESMFGNYINKRIDVENLVLDINGTQYNELAKYFRDQDRIETFRNAVENVVEQYENAEELNLLIADEYIEEMSLLFDENTAYSGEDELNALEECLKKLQERSNA